MRVSAKMGNWKDLPGIWRLGSLRDEMSRSFYRATTFGWPLYDLRHYLTNVPAKRLYRAQKKQPLPGSVQKRVINDLVQKGISINHINDFSPGAAFCELQELTERLIQTRENQDIISQMENGTRALNSSNLVRLLGNTPTNASQPMHTGRVLSLGNVIFDIGLNDKILEIVCGYLGMVCRLLAVDLWYNLPMGGPGVFSQRWHRDPDDRKQVKLFLYLRDVSETTGPFCYIPGTHNRGPFKDVYPQTIRVSNYPPDGAVDKLFSEEKRLVCVGKAGTLILCDTTGLHKGGLAVAEPRLLFNAVYQTNAGALLHQKRFGKNYAIADSGSGSLGPMASYAVGLNRLDETRS